MLRTIDPRTDPAWRDLMMTPRGSLFGCPPWLSALGDTYGFDIAANITTDESGAATTGLAYAQVDDFLGSRVLSVPFCDYIDPIVDTTEQWNELVTPLIERGLPLQLRVLDSDIPRHDERFAHADELAWHTTDLEQEEETLFAG